VVPADPLYTALLDVPATVIPADRTRGTYIVVDEQEGDVLEIHEPPLGLSAHTAAELEREATRAAAAADVVVCSGGVPPGLSSDLHATVTRAARGFSVVDTSSPAALTAALAAGPGLVAPNLAEARALLGDHSPPELARRLRAAGARYAWVSLGAEGSVLAGPAGIHRLRAPAVARVVNAVGAGDALLGGLAAGLARGLAVLDAARLGVAAATDKVGHLHFAQVDARAVERLVARVTVEPIE
jgi:fructose-1-phosphate kinase PfkB-like protein